LFIKGSVPGSKGTWLTIKDAVKIDRPADVPYPGAVLSSHVPVVEEPAIVDAVIEDAVVEETAVADAAVASDENKEG
jgi:large subunit ribosomal protein L3